MTVTKHDMEWLANALNAAGEKLPEELAESVRELLASSGYHRKVCVIQPVDEADYRRVRMQLEAWLRSNLGRG